QHRPLGAAARRAPRRGARAAAARVPRPHGARVHPDQARRERLEHLAHGVAAGHRAHQPAQEDARAGPLAREPGTVGVMKRGPLGVAGLLGFTAVAFGAFGAHSLRARLSPPMLEIYRTGALYHLVHAVAAL